MCIVRRCWQHSTNVMFVRWETAQAGRAALAGAGRGASAAGGSACATFSRQAVARRGYGEAPVLHPLDRDERVGQLLDQSGLALHQNHFETIVVIQMHVQRGEHRVVIMML